MKDKRPRRDSNSRMEAPQLKQQNERCMVGL